MNDQNPPASAENRLSETESSPVPRGTSPEEIGGRLSNAGRREPPRQSLPETKQVKIVLRVTPTESQPEADVTAPLSQPVQSPEASGVRQRADSEPQPIPARMLNEFVYCQRLFYYEFVEGVFVESADTLRGGAIHQRVDSGNGELPKAKRKATTDKSKGEEKPAAAESASTEPEAPNAELETIHSRSVQMGSDRLGVVAKMDLVEVRAAR